MTLDPNQPVASLGALPDKLIMCVMADAKPLILHDNIDLASFLALTTPKGKEIIDAETFRRQYEEERWDALENKASGLVGATAPGAPAASSSPAQLLADIAASSVMSPVPPMLVLAAKMTLERFAVAVVPLPLLKETAGSEV